MMTKLMRANNTNIAKHSGEPRLDHCNCGPRGSLAVAWHGLARPGSQSAPVANQANPNIVRMTASHVGTAMDVKNGIDFLTQNLIETLKVECKQVMPTSMNLKTCLDLLYHNVAKGTKQGKLRQKWKSFEGCKISSESRMNSVQTFNCTLFCKYLLIFHWRLHSYFEGFTKYGAFKVWFCLFTCSKEVKISCIKS